jgi:hypothetical protein
MSAKNSAILVKRERGRKGMKGSEMGGNDAKEEKRKVDRRREKGRRGEGSIQIAEQRGMQETHAAPPR